MDIVIIESEPDDAVPFDDDDSYNPGDYVDEGSDLTLNEIEEHASDNDYDSGEYEDG